jgi:hypothetical protein
VSFELEGVLRGVGMALPDHKAAPVPLSRTTGQARDLDPVWVRLGPPDLV